MYIWVACDVDDSFQELRRICLEKNRDIGLDTKAFVLPAHISLKISFFVEDAAADGVIDALRSYFARAPLPTALNPKIEQNGGILWLTYEQNSALQKMHDELDALMLTYGIEQHPFDKCFTFHTTLFIDEREDAVAQMKQSLSRITLPRIISIKQYLIGTSDTGKAGEYSVKETI